MGTVIAEGCMTATGTTRVRWLLVFWLFVLSAVSYLDRVNISIAGGAIVDAYHLTDVQLGKVFSSLVAGYALFQTIGGQLADRFGPRRVLTGGVIWWGIFTALTALVPANFAGALLAFMAVRFLLGAGEAVIYPAANQFVSRWIPVRERGIANGWIFAGVGAGAGLAPPLVSYLMIRYGWRSSFWVCASLGLIVGGVWFWMARDTPAEHSGVSSAELATIESGLTIAQIDGTKGELARVPWKRVAKSVNVWALTVSYFCYGYMAWIFFSWFYRYLVKVRGLDLKASALYSMLPPFAMLLCCLVGGVINDRLTKWRGPRVGRCFTAAVSMAIAGVFIALGARVEGVRLGQRRLSRRRGRALSIAKLLLVGDGRHRRWLSRFRFRVHEHGRPNRRSRDRITDTLDRRSLRLDCLVPGCSRVVCDWCRLLVSGQSAEDINGRQ